MKIALIGVAASVALASAASIGIAQMPEPKGGGEPSGKAQGPASPGPAAKEPGGKGDGTPRGPATGEPQRAPDAGKAKQGSGETKGKDQPKATQGQPGTDQPKATEGRPGKEQPKATEGRPGKEQPKATEGQPGKEQPKATEGRPSKEQPKATEGQPGKEQPKATQGQPEKGQKSTQGRQDGTRVQVSEEQRGGVRERVLKEGKAQKTKLNISVNVGTKVPRSVRLLPLSVAIIELAPAYRGYSYVVLEDETIIIVEPRTYAVVDVIAAGAQRAERPQRGMLSLSQEQMRFIYSSVPKEPRAGVRVRLALGADIPADVELLPFPGEVVARIPDVDRYRYIVAENDIVVVDPNGRSVALVISE